MGLGNRIRARRQDLSLSLRDVAAKTGLTASFLSQMERDLASPSLESLRKVSDALEVPIFYFLAEPSTEDSVVRHDERLRLTLPRSNLTYQLLSPSLSLKMEPFLVELSPGEKRIAFPLREQTEEFIYVLQGLLEIQLADDTHLLGPGDSVYFEGALLRLLRAQGDEVLRFISVITPPIF